MILKLFCQMSFSTFTLEVKAKNSIFKCSFLPSLHLESYQTHAKRHPVEIFPEFLAHKIGVNKSYQPH